MNDEAARARQQIALAVLARRHEALILSRCAVSYGDWRPLPHHCYENVTTWVSAKPEHKKVLGFSVVDMSAFGYVQIIAHCVVEIEDGTLVDITPHCAESDYPFIRHVGSAADFAAIGEVGETEVPLAMLPPSAARVDRL